MSKQPSAPGRASSRFAGPVGWIRDLPIWTKLGLIMIVPTLATILVGTVGLLDQVELANNAERARALAVLSGEGGVLVHRLQNERAFAIQLLKAPPADAERVKGEYLNAQQQTDTAHNRYRQGRATIADIPANLRALLDNIDGQLSELPVMRSQVEGITKVPLSIAERRYRVLIADLLGIRDLAAQLTGDTTLTDRMRAAAAVATAKEFLSQERVVVLQALAEGEMTQAVRRDYIATLKGQELALGSFSAVATAEQIELLNRTLAGPELRETLFFEGELDSLRQDQSPNDVVRADAWDRAMVGRANLMSDVEAALNQQAQDAAVAVGSVVQRRVLLQTGLLLLTLLLGVLFAWLVARSMARSLRDLRQGALAVAQYGLPQAVARLRDPALSSHLSPAGVALQIAEPLPVRSKDEFGQVTEAFNAVHLEAVRTAAEQAALRASVATMFVNLARRSQILVDRLIGHLDRLERGEQDPDRLAELFQLDHLATRMRRNDENLLVLAGADSTRIQREPAALMDVLRAAQSEVEHYTRIEFATIDQDIEIAAHAVNDLVHLVAELLDNATAFSAPDTAIVVEARRVGDRSVLQVEDRGIGMSPDQYSELNERLATPPMVDVAVSRMMGLVVVARLAARHGVKVELRAAQERGTVADVLLPSGVLVPRALAGRAHAPVGFPAAKPLVQPSSGRSLFPPPLALESGPSMAGAGAGGAPSWSGEQQDYRYNVPRPATTPFPAPPPTTPPTFGGNPPPMNVPPMNVPPTNLPPLGASPFSTPPLPTPPTFGPPGPGGLGGGLGANGLGQRLASEFGASTGVGPNGHGLRGLPAWADLTGSSETDSGGGAGSGGLDPLPQRRPGQWGDPEPDLGGPVIPRQPPAGPDSWPARDSVYSGPPAPSASTLPPLGASNLMPPGFVPGPPAASRPPAWPPVAPDPSGGMPSRLPDAGGYGESPVPPSRYADDLTMELPIFRELESAWFQEPVPRSDTSPAPMPGGWPPEPASTPASSAGSAAGAPYRTDWSGGSGGAADTSDAVSWRTIADDGWHAAQAAMEPEDGGTTDMGLPKRVPMAQLVPGGVEVAGAGSDRRTPDSVRGLLSAYTRGVQRGRDAQGSQSDPTTTSQSSGREQEA